jgi:hypothetical protein
MLPDTGIDDVKKQRNAEYAKHINDPVLSSLKMEGICLLSFFRGNLRETRCGHPCHIWTLYVRGNEQENVDTLPVICTRVYLSGTFQSLIKVRPAVAAEMQQTFAS